MTAQLRVCVSADAMSAAIRIPGDFPRQMLASELLLQCAREAGVLVSREVMAAVGVLASGPPKEGVEAEVVIARGTPADHGQASVLTWTIDRERADAVKSFYDRTPYVTVAPGAVLGTVTQPTPGTDGVNVRGETLKARQGAACPVQFRDSLMLKPDGTLVALQGGLLIRSASAAWIGKVLEIPGDVDFTSGNIDFDGDIAIRGGIKDTFKVKATGSVIVDGPIGAATIECGGDLIVRYGAAGSFKGTIHVGGGLTARYLEAVIGTVKGDARIERDLIDCDLTIEGTCLSPTASMIGGKLTVAGKAAFKVIGSRASAKTKLVLGSLRSADDTLRTATAELEAASAGLRTRQDEYDMLTARGKTLTPAQRERQTELQFEVYELTAKRDACRAAIAEAKSASESRSSVGLEVTERLHEGTTLSVLGVDYTIRSDIAGPLRVTASGGQAVIAFGQGVSHPLGAMLRRAA
jgi:uncharacterized protein (DUF342 family)